MSNDDPFDTDEWRALDRDAREKLEPMLRDSTAAVSVYDGTEIHPKMALELGYMIMLDKPIIAVVTPGVKVPAKLAIVADEIVEMLPSDPSFSNRMMEAVGRAMAKQEEDKQ